MNKRTGISLAISAVVMLGLPWIAVTLVSGDSAMAVCFLLFYAVNPICAVATGVLAGKEGLHRWYLPVAAVAMFLIGVWAFFDIREGMFIIYGGKYLILGLGAMLLTDTVRRKKQKEQ